MGGLTFPGGDDAGNYIGGRIQTVDPATGTVTDLYTECDGRPLLAPNDLVFDAHGGFYFTDHGVVDDEERDPPDRRHLLRPGRRLGDHGGRVPVRRPERHRPLAGRHEAVLGRDVARTHPAARHRRRRARSPSPALVDTVRSACYGFPGLQLLDSLAVDSAGNVCVATIVNGGVSVISPQGELVDFVATGDLITTNVCFGGADLTTAYITLSTTGRLVKMTWPRPGLALAHLNT